MNGATPPPPPRPAVIVWFWVFCILGVLIDLMWMAAVAISLVVEHHRDDEIAWMIGIVVFSVPFTLAFAVAPFLPRRRWVWIYDIVVLCIGIASCCCIPAAIPLLIFWIRSDVEQWFSNAGPVARA